MANSDRGVAVYDGLSDPKLFIQQFEIQCLVLDWDGTKQAINFPKYLSGKAAKAIQIIGVKTDVKDYFNALLKACELPQPALMRKFYDRRRKPNETMAQFNSALSGLLWAACPTMAEEHQSMLIKKQLSVGLPEGTQNLLNIGSACANTASWDTLLQCLDGIDAEYQVKSEPMVNIKNEPLELNYASSSNRQIGRPAQQRVNKQSEQRQFDGTCDYCHRYGHKASFCSTRARERERQYQRPSYSNLNNNYGAGSNLHNRSGNNSKPKQDGFNTNNYNTNNYPNRARNAGISSNNAELGDEEEPDFPSNMFANAIEIGEMSVNTSGNSSLLRVIVKFSIFNQQPITVSALVDGGSTHTFISPDVLTPIQKAIINDSSNAWCGYKPYNITGVTGATRADCAFTKASLTIGGEWQGSMTVVISDAVRNHDMIIGNDFLSKFDAKVNHGCRTVNIGSDEINCISNNTSKELEAEVNIAELKNEISDLRKQLNCLVNLKKGSHDPVQDVKSDSTVSN